MVFAHKDVWTWDMWFADDGEQYHVFYLKASRALGDPDRRHFHVTVGHAVSADLESWTEVADALIISDAPAFDDATTWTGSVVKAPDGTWRMFYTGTTRREDAKIQRVGVASSPDLFTWTKHSTQALAEADPTWYEKYDGTWHDEAWRDPWVFADPDGQGWHMLVTARANHGETFNRGVIGHLSSQDLQTWTVQPPLSEPGAGFGQLEVPQVATVEGRHVLIFCCNPPEYSPELRATGVDGGVWAVPIDSLTGPYDISTAYPLTDTTLYAGRLLQDRDGAWWLFAFLQKDEEGDFVGALSSPIPVGWNAEGRLVTYPGGRP